MAKQKALKVIAPTKLWKLDLGCGRSKREGFTGVDIMQMDGKVDVVTDLRQTWPWADNSVEEVNCSHFLEHLIPEDRIHFANELYRVMMPGAKCTLVVPHYRSERAYGDLTHVWPPVVGFWFAYLDKSWRESEVPYEKRYTCDFKGSTWGYTVNQALNGRSPEYVQNALTWWSEAAQDMVATLTKAPA